MNFKKIFGKTSCLIICLQLELYIFLAASIFGTLSKRSFSLEAMEAKLALKIRELKCLIRVCTEALTLK